MLGSARGVRPHEAPHRSGGGDRCPLCAVRRCRKTVAQWMRKMRLPEGDKFGEFVRVTPDRVDRSSAVTRRLVNLAASKAWLLTALEG